MRDEREGENEMRRPIPLAMGLSAAVMILAAAPAFAGYGALAFDKDADRFGYSFDRADQEQANRLALKGCGTTHCEVVMPVAPRMCGALAVGKKAWGTAAKPTRDAAKLAAMNDCQKHTGGQCEVRASVCNH
jgi:hypothetical protein